MYAVVVPLPLLFGVKLNKLPFYHKHWVTRRSTERLVAGTIKKEIDVYSVSLQAHSGANRKYC